MKKKVYTTKVANVRHSADRVVITTQDDVTFWIERFENGFVTCVAFPGTDINAFAKAISGSFAEGSNFALELCKAYGVSANTELLGIKARFQEVEVLATPDDYDADSLCDRWVDKLIREYYQFR